MDDITFRAMGSSCRVVVDGPSPDLGRRARGIVADLEARWSRFLPTSEISGANRAAGRPTMVSLPTYRLIEHAVEAHRLTDGCFDPLLLDSLESLGYDRDHHQLAIPGPTDSSSDPLGSAQATRATDGVGREPDGVARKPNRRGRLTLEPGLSAVTVPSGARFDPGGIGKGLATDIVARDLVEQGAWWVMVGLGGDLRFAGDSVAAHGWTTVVEDPRDAERELGRLRVNGGAIATSSRLRRRWSHAGRTHHHLLDPATGAPGTTRVVAATVQAHDGWLADVLAKCVVIAGPDRAEPWLDAVGAGAIVSFDDRPPRRIGPIALLEDSRVQ